MPWKLISSLVLHILLIAPAAAAAAPFDYPTANISTKWTIGPSLEHVTCPDGSKIHPLLLRGSLGPSFAFGFFCYFPCNAFLLSIYIVYTNDASEITELFTALPQVVWTANRDRPVHDNATLLFSPDGDLVLRDADGAFSWSTNTSGRGVASLNLLDSGNLVLADRQNSSLWASFDHPTDSLLVGQTLREGQRLTANSSTTNTTTGYLYLAILHDGLKAFVDSNPPQLYYSNSISGPSNAQNRSAYVTFNNGSLDMFVLFTQPGVPDLSISLPSADQASQYMRLDFDGHLRLYGWSNNWEFLREVIDPSPDDCAYPTVCGQYGICSEGQCVCPQAANDEFSYFKPVNASQTNLGCVSVTPLACQSINSHRLLPLDNISYFNYVDDSTIALHATDAESCKLACLGNCSCKAAFFQYGRDASQGSCYLPSQVFSLMNNRPELTHYNSSVFIKVQSALAPASAPVGAISHSKGATKLTWRITVVIGVASSFILTVLIIAFIWVIRVRRRGKQLDDEDQFKEIPGMASGFSYEELKLATNNFEEKLGQGGFGTVYKGKLGNGILIAVKRLDDVGQGKNQFLAEVATIGGIHHINLVRLIGFCVDKSHRLLVFEYVPNGSLDRWIFGKTKDISLDWPTRCRIIIGIAKGLSYLHEECQQRIAHLDIKPQNILLDEKFNAKVADFGLSKLIDRDLSEIMTRMRGTPGYLAPEWLTSIITEKVDVYSFGVVVLEIICGRKNLDPSQSEEAVHLIALLQEKIRDNLLIDLFDKNSNDIHLHSEEVIEMMRLAIWCLQRDCNQRPSMSMVLKVLEGASNVDFNIDTDLFGDNLYMSQKACSSPVSPSTSLLSSYGCGR